MATDDVIDKCGFIVPAPHVYGVVSVYAGILVSESPYLYFSKFTHVYVNMSGIFVRLCYIAHLSIFCTCFLLHSIAHLTVLLRVKSIQYFHFPFLDGFALKMFNWFGFTATNVIGFQ